MARRRRDLRPVDVVEPAAAVELRRRFRRLSKRMGVATIDAPLGRSPIAHLHPEVEKLRAAARTMPPADALLQACDLHDRLAAAWKRARPTRSWPQWQAHDLVGAWRKELGA